MNMQYVFAPSSVAVWQLGIIPADSIDQAQATVQMLNTTETQHLQTLDRCFKYLMCSNWRHAWKWNHEYAYLKLKSG